MSPPPQTAENETSGSPQPTGTIWITGLSASGKTTLGRSLAAALYQRGYRCTLLDGDELRRRMGNRRGHSLEDRYAALRDVVMAALDEKAHRNIPIVATISHKRAMRRFAKYALGRVLEVYLDCPSAVCADRDYKGHYQRAYAGEYACFIGVTEPYEVWDKADVIIDTAHSTEAEACRALLVAALEFLGGG